LRLKLGQAQRRRRSRRSRGRGVRRGIIGRATADLSNGYARAVARHAVEVQTDQDVAKICRHRIVQPHDHHVDAVKGRHRADVLNLQWIDYAGRILRVCAERTGWLARQKIQVHTKQCDARP